MAIENYKLDLGGLHGGAWNQVSLVFQVNNGSSENNIFVAKKLVDDFHADRLTDWRGLFPNEYGLEWARARRISVGGGKSRTREYPGSSGQGTRAGDTASLALAPVVKLHCGMTADTQGRIFLPCVSESDLDQNILDAGYVNDVVTFFGDLVGWTGSISSLTWNLSVYSPKLSNAFPVVAITVSSIIGNQRKRRVPR